jgi:alpha-tubulin suppressor-like RCC1 family protein
VGIDVFSHKRFAATILSMLSVLVLTTPQVYAATDMTTICRDVAPAPFADIHANDVHKSHIDCAYQLALVDPSTTTQFGSYTTVTRGEAALFILNLISNTPMTLNSLTGEVSLSSTQTSDEAALATLAQNNLLPHTELAATTPMTRGEFVQLLFNTQQRLGVTFPNAANARFDDIDRHDVNAIALANITVGRTSTRFGATLPLRRGQAATLLTRSAVHLDSQSLWRPTPSNTQAPAPAPAPAVLALAYPTTTFSTAQTSESVAPTVTGGTADSFAITDGQLPQGVRLDLKTGEFTGPSAWNLSITAISSGTQHTCALLADTTVRCWGSNSNGQLGIGTTAVTRETVPVAVLKTGSDQTNSATYKSGFTQISTGNSHTCGVLTDRTAVCWGNNGSGRLGDGETTSRSLPVEVTGLTGVIAISAGSTHTCAVVETDAADPSKNEVRCWGNNSNGRLGDGSTTASSSPVPVRTSETGNPRLTGVLEIGASSNHTCALMADSEVQCWGDNSSGQLGDGTSNARSNPVKVSVAAGAVLTGATSLTVFHDHSCVTMDDAAGTARCWGRGLNGRIGDGTTNNSFRAAHVLTPEQDPFSGVTRISVGITFTCALMADETVRCWGQGGESGYLSDGSAKTGPIHPERLNPVAVVMAGGSQNDPATYLNGVTMLAAGSDHTCAANTQTVLCWGRGSSGQLGIGTTPSQGIANMPTPVTGLGNPGWPATVTITVTDTDGKTASVTKTFTTTP